MRGAATSEIAGRKSDPAPPLANGSARFGRPGHRRHLHDQRFEAEVRYMTHAREHDETLRRPYQAIVRLMHGPAPITPGSHAMGAPPMPRVAWVLVPGGSYACPFPCSSLSHGRGVPTRGRCRIRKWMGGG